MDLKNQFETVEGELTNDPVSSSDVPKKHSVK